VVQRLGLNLRGLIDMVVEGYRVSRFFPHRSPRQPVRPAPPYLGLGNRGIIDSTTPLGLTETYSYQHSIVGLPVGNQ